MDIKQALCALEHSPEWVDRYVEFLASTTEPEEGFGERHHILPRALFPEFRKFKDHPWNLIRLSPADHLLAHYYLYRAIPSTRTRFAFRMMVGTKSMSLIEQGFNEAVVLEVAGTYAESKASLVLTEEHKARIRAGNRRWHRENKESGGDYAYMPRGDSHHRRIFGISDETKAKISAALAGRTQDPAVVETRRLKLVGQRKPWSPEARARRSEALRGIRPGNGLTFAGRRHTQASLDKKSAAMKALHLENPNHPCFTNKPSGEDHWTYGKARPAATRAAISEALMGKTASEETRRRMSATRERLAYEKIPQAEHDVYRASLDLTTEDEAILQRRAFKINSRPYNTLTGIMMIRLGKATEANRRYWQAADTWIRLSGNGGLVQPLQPRG